MRAGKILLMTNVVYQRTKIYKIHPHLQRLSLHLQALVLAVDLTTCENGDIRYLHIYCRARIQLQLTLSLSQRLVQKPGRN